MKVLLFGHSGYVGHLVLKKLYETGNEIVCISRRNTQNQLYPEVKYIKGDVLKPETYLKALENCDVIIYLPGLIREFPNKGITFNNVHYAGVKYLVDNAEKYGVKKFVLLSANGVRENAPTKYLQTKHLAEKYLMQSKLEWIIFRPSVIFGFENSAYKNFITVIKDLSKMPLFFPVIGNGKYRFQPVSLNNLSDAIIYSIKEQNPKNKIFYACGPEVLSYNEIVDIVLKSLKKKRIKLFIPIKFMLLLAKLFERYEWFPVSKEQIIMLLEENICKGGENIFDYFPLKPLSFREINL